MNLGYIDRNIYLESARVYLKRSNNATLVIKCCLCSADAITEWNAFLQHLALRHGDLHKSEDRLEITKVEVDEEIQAEVEVELANLREAEQVKEGDSADSTSNMLYEEYIDDSEDAESEDGDHGDQRLKDDGTNTENYVLNRPTRPFYSLMRTTPELIFHFIQLLREHACHWHEDYKDSYYKTERMESAVKISRALAERWNVALLPQVICTSARTLQRWFESQFAAHISHKVYKCRYPEYYEKLLEFLPTKHICVLICDECERRFDSDSRLRQHKYREHRGAAPYACDICRMDFLHASKLRIHQSRYHTKPIGWKCRLCEYNAPSKWDYRIHLASHTGARNYSCEICGNTYKTSTTLAVHRRTHQSPTLECSYCQKKFRENYRLKVHIQKEHECENPRNFACCVCRRRFESEKVLQLHELIHKTVKANETAECELFSCPSCSLVFDKKSDMWQHFELSHSDLIKIAYNLNLMPQLCRCIRPIDIFTELSMIS